MLVAGVNVVEGEIVTAWAVSGMAALSYSRTSQLSRLRSTAHLLESFVQHNSRMLTSQVSVLEATTT